jgi:hypothetical protein
MIYKFFVPCLAFSFWIASQCVIAQGVTVEFDDDNRENFSEETRAVIMEIALNAEADARRLLPQFPTEILLTISAGSFVVAETGSGGASLEPGHIEWTVDTTRPEGAENIARSYLRSTLFHEMHHQARGWAITGGGPVTSFMDAVVSEGMATVFEREFAGSNPLYGDYPEDIDDWVDELLTLGMSAFESYPQWMFQHTDGRRWIGYRAGTYIVDQAIVESGLSSVEMVLMPTEEVLGLAGIR